MTINRRALLSSGAAMTALFASSLAHAASQGRKHRWENPGTDKAFGNRLSAMNGRPAIFKQFGYSPVLVDVAIKVTTAPPEKKPHYIHVGDHLDHMATGREGVWTDVPVDFKRPMLGKRVEPGVEITVKAEKWTFVYEGATYTILLPEVCHNWADIREEDQCYKVLMDYSGQLDVEWDREGNALVSVHFYMTDAELSAKLGEHCFQVHDENGSRKPRVGCANVCKPDARYPDDRIATFEGLPVNLRPDGQPHGIISFELKGGKGYLSLPSEIKNAENRQVYCVHVIRYVGPDTGWQWDTRFDIVLPDEFRRTFPARRLDRVLKGEHRMT